MITVARYLRNLWKSLTGQLVADDDVQIVLDRRQGERRQQVQAVNKERRGADRRQPLTFDFSEVRGFLGEGIGLKGDLSFSGAVRVDGHLEGEFVRGEILIIGEPGLVNAGINVSILQISGQVQGNITARQRVELLRPSRVTGTIRTPCLVIWKGAVFNGKIDMASPQEDGGGGPEGKEETPTAGGAGAGPPSVTP
jgi:cytoskeletal protein CcmA (bactofilin family)